MSKIPTLLYRNTHAITRLFLVCVSVCARTQHSGIRADVCLAGVDGVKRKVTSLRVKW